MDTVIAAYRQWKLARIRYKKSLQRDGEKGPIVRRALRELIGARANVRIAIEVTRDANTRATTGNRASGESVRLG